MGYYRLKGIRCKNYVQAMVCLAMVYAVPQTTKEQPGQSVQYVLQRTDLRRKKPKGPNTKQKESYRLKDTKTIFYFIGSMIMQVEEKGGNIIITIPKNVKPVPSSTQKTLIVASSHGFIPTSLQVDGRPVSAMVNLTVKNPEYVKP